MARKIHDRADRPHHWMSNDPLMNRQYEGLRAFRADIPETQGRVGVIIGTGGLLSMADALPPVVYVTDIQDLALEWVHRSVATMEREPNPERFLKGISIELKGSRAADDGEQRVIDWEKKSFGQYHFLSSQSRYDECRAAVGKHTFRYVNIDYAAPGQVAAFGDQLRADGEAIDTFNATNVHNVIFQRTGYVEALKDLPWADPYRILCSSFDPNEPGYIPPLPSLDEYSGLMQSRYRS